MTAKVLYHGETVDPAQYPALAATANQLPGAISECHMSLDVNPPTTRRNLTTVKLTLAVVDDEAVELFAYGYCVLLAGAMFERSGWQRAAIAHPDGPLTEDQEPDRWLRARWTHVGLITPDGRFLDINGARPVDEVNTEYGGWLVRPVTAEEWDEAGCGSHWTTCITDELTKDVFRLFADALVSGVEEGLENL